MGTIIVFGRPVEYDPSLFYLMAHPFQEGLEYKQTTPEELLRGVNGQPDIKMARGYAGGRRIALQQLLQAHTLWQEHWKQSGSKRAEPEKQGKTNTRQGLENSRDLYQRVCEALKD